MKQIVLCVLTGTLLVLMSSCGSDDDNKPADGLSKDTRTPDKGDNTNGCWIEDGAGRISADEDGFSEKE